MAKRKSVINNNTNEVKTFIIVILVVALVLVGLYFASKALTKNGTIGEEYKPSNVPEAVMTYEQLNIGMIFNRADKEYYVAFGEFNEKEKSGLETLVDRYSAEDKHKAIYKVDMSKSYNKQYLSEESNINATTDNELKLKTPTLIKIQNGKIVKYIENLNDIKSELN